MPIRRLNLRSLVRPPSRLRPWGPIVVCLTFGLGLPRSDGFAQGVASPASRVVGSTTPYNLHLVVTESALNRFVANQESEVDRIDDFVFGAKVDGEQFISRQLRLDLKPGFEQATAQFVLTGQIQSRTTGRTEQGAVHSLGYQEFVATKDVYFNGTEFSTRHATVMARSSNQPVGASTPLDGTFLARLGQKIALNRAEEQRPQTEAYARGKVADRVYPTFDGNVDRQLAMANQRLRDDLRTMLERARLLPTAQRTTTTEQHLHYAARFAQPAEAPPCPTPRTTLAGPHAASLYLHEELVNGLFDRFELAGKRTTDRELKTIFGRAREFLGGRDDTAEPAPSSGFSLPGMGALETAIEFDPVDPLRLRFRDNQGILEIRATVKPAGQSLLPPLRISVPLEFQNDLDSWRLVRGPIDIEPTSGGTLPDVARTLIRQAIEGDFPTFRLPRELTLPGWPANQPRPQLTQIQAADGWLAVSVD